MSKSLGAQIQVVGQLVQDGSTVSVVCWVITSSKISSAQGSGSCSLQSTSIWNTKVLFPEMINPVGKSAYAHFTTSWSSPAVSLSV